MTPQGNTLRRNGLRGERSALNAHYQTLGAVRNVTGRGALLSGHATRDTSRPELSPGGAGVKAPRSRSDYEDALLDHAIGEF